MRPDASLRLRSRSVEQIHAGCHSDRLGLLRCISCCYPSLATHGITFIFNFVQDGLPPTERGNLGRCRTVMPSLSGTSASCWFNHTCILSCEVGENCKVIFCLRCIPFQIQLDNIWVDPHRVPCLACVSSRVPLLTRCFRHLLCILNRAPNWASFRKCRVEIMQASNAQMMCVFVDVYACMYFHTM